MQVQRTAYAILFIDKATGRLLRGDTASDFPVAGLLSEAQVILAEVHASEYDAARRRLLDVLRHHHAWARPLFRPGTF